MFFNKKALWESLVWKVYHLLRKKRYTESIVAYRPNSRVSTLLSITVSAFGAVLFVALLGGWISFNDRDETQLAAPAGAVEQENR